MKDGQARRLPPGSFFFSSRRRHTRWPRDWISDVCSSDLGCYSDLVEAALGQCTELRFLNPGIEVCVAHCHRRLWEPEKFSSAQQQGAMLEQLVLWVKQYEIRDDEYGLKRHRKIFEQFAGSKREFTSLISYDEG